MIEVGGVKIALVIFLCEHLDLVEQFASFFIPDRAIDGRHHGLQVGEGLSSGVGGALLVASEQLVGIEAHQHHLIDAASPARIACC